MLDQRTIWNLTILGFQCHNPTESFQFFFIEEYKIRSTTFNNDTLFAIIFEAFYD